MYTNTSSPTSCVVYFRWYALALLNLFNTLSLKKFKTKHLVQIAVEEQTRRQTVYIVAQMQLLLVQCSSFIKHTYKTLQNKSSRYIATSILWPTLTQSTKHNAMSHTISIYCQRMYQYHSHTIFCYAHILFKTAPTSQ